VHSARHLVYLRMKVNLLLTWHDIQRMYNHRHSILRRHQSGRTQLNVESVTTANAALGICNSTLRDTPRVRSFARRAMLGWHLQHR
jgi:hypothetical protein